MKYSTQTVPRLSPNDADLKIVCWLVEEGAYVTKGKDLYTAESSKAVSDIQAEFEGFVYFLAGIGEWVEIGKPVVIFASRKDDNAKKDFLKLKQAHEANKSGDRKFTKKAELVAKEYGIDINEIKSDGVIREEDVLNHLRKQTSNHRYEAHESLWALGNFGSEKRVVVIGAGVGAAQIVDIILRSKKQQVVGLLDDNPLLQGKTVFDQKILGPIGMIHQLWKAGSFDGAIVSFSNDLTVRMKVFQDLVLAGVPFTNIIDPSVQINSNVKLGVGNVVLAGTVLGACVRIGDNNFISAHVNIEHHSVVGNGCSFGPGVMTSGEVKIGDQVKFGTGIFIEPQIHIGDRSTISSGLAVTGDIPQDVVVKKDLDYRIVKKSDIKDHQLKP